LTNCKFAKITGIFLEQGWPFDLPLLRGGELEIAFDRPAGRPAIS
jgi:hypothetical protein